MKKLVAFAGSNSRHSINKQLATYASGLVENAQTTVLDLNDFDVPIFGVDLEKDMGGQPENAHKLLKFIQESDGIVLSLAENNGAYAAVFKNLMDWLSRIEGQFFGGKPMLLMATSPGGRGGQSVLDIAKDRFPRHNAEIATTFSLPNFNDNFSEGKITNTKLDNELKEAITIFADKV